MIEDKGKSFIMAQRLRELRNKKGLSYETLRKSLMEKYGVDISVDSLKNYEVTTPHHKKAYKNLGMRVEYLQTLADFYGVSTDYILARTNDPAPTTAAVDDLGLSPQVINWLREFKTASQPEEGTDYIPHEGLIQTVNQLFENIYFQDLVRKLCNLMDGIVAEEIYYSIPWEADLSNKIQAIAGSGRYNSPVVDLLRAQNVLGSDLIDTFMPIEHAFGLNVTDILNNDVNRSVSRLVDSLQEGGKGDNSKHTRKKR